MTKRKLIDFDVEATDEGHVAFTLAELQEIMDEAKEKFRDTKTDVTDKLKCGCVIVHRKKNAIEYQTGLEAALNPESKLCPTHEAELGKAIDSTGKELRLQEEASKA